MGHEKVDNYSRNGRPSSSRTEINMEQVRHVMYGNRWLTVRMIANQPDLEKDSAWKITTEGLNMRKICTKLVPKLLNDRCDQLCQGIMKRLQTEKDLLCKVFTDDKTDFWVWAWNQTPKQPVEVSDVIKDDESNGESHVDQVLRCDEHFPRRVLAREPDDQSVF